jgi:hypothetical protein
MHPESKVVCAFNAVPSEVPFERHFVRRRKLTSVAPELVRAAHSPFDREYAPFAGNTLERMAAAVTKAQARTRHQVLNGT